MIAYIQGIVASYGSDYVVIDQNGIGWQIAYAHCDALKLNDPIKIYTYMHFSENETSLFGFQTQEEKDLFLRLISVKGLGPKTAMNMLSKSGYQAIISSVEQGDVTALKKMPGIGAKTASQIVLDLKGKLVSIDNIVSKSTLVNDYPQEILDAIEGLKGLGYKSNELTHVAEAMKEKVGLSTKEYLQFGLRYLAKQKLGG